MGKGTVVVIDGGGRGAALVHKYSESSHVKKIIAIPGNDLMALNTGKNVETHQNISTTSAREILEICKKENPDLIDVAQDNAVEAGVTDALLEKGFNVSGPTRAAGQIEWDKAWSRNFMIKYGLPSPVFKVFNSTATAKEFIEEQKEDKVWFIKAAGLAEGKGVIPAGSNSEALEKIDEIKNFGSASETFLIEEGLKGEEFSMFAISDGKTFQIIGSAQDHKRLYDGDLGPNTGGMGCSTPPLVVTKDIYKQAEKIIKKTIDGLSEEGRRYCGILYLGAMVVSGEVFVIEFNARWGDPEAEVIIPGIQNDMFEVGMNVARGTLSDIIIKTDDKARVVVTGALKPGTTVTKRELFGVDKISKLPNVLFYGTRVTYENGRYFVSSGRLFHVVGEGKTVIEAREKAYEAMAQLRIEGDYLHFRTDIGWRDVERLKKNKI